MAGLRWGLLACTFAVCVGCSTFSVRRAALVPHQQPILRSGQSMGQTVHELSFGSSTVANLANPREVRGANAGVAIPRWQLNGGYRHQVSEDFDIGVSIDWGLDRKSHSVNTDQPDPDNGDVRGAGMSLYRSIETSELFRVAVSAELMIYSVPYVEYRTCATNCAGIAFTDVDRDRDYIPVVSFGVVPSWRLSPNWVLFGGMNVRNHPTIRKGDIEMIDLNDDEEVEAGPANVIASGGLEFEMSNGLKAMAYIFQPVYADPVRYGPTVGIGFAVPLQRTNPPPQQALPTATAY